MRLPRDVDIRSLAAILFAFVVIMVFGGIAVVGVVCRIGGDATLCLGNNPEVLSTFKSLIENIVAILLALMAGTAGRSPPPPPG